ncbi:MTAP family purine nucleoside phosphorylase [Subtercola boreus]|uniref:S-methyl-5'-thioadenosine phosphorylase n=1 Tax=Subtercola boreus TaxID=120213 RepID=A0A3E0WBC2_9MICO|nr:MTAP family purine nucleoside phosphorylase [Subtercola boreus]RFA19788.1 5'-methylthioadenosine phosphorylase [Subtercola boreus]RFA19813.1 5'-methylthioadenosine phosphorylase [Subtercola boreus]RFA26208.1 5'-methylthioadenosine phosphorylase [Subtercola boreus]
MTDTPSPDGPLIAVIGGSGLYTLFDDAVTVQVPTPFGPTSSPITVGRIGGRSVAFLTRHGADHSVPPHLINYRANIWALKSLGVKAIISSAAVGGVSPEYPPGTLVLTDQFIDRTWGRPDTFYDRGSVQHLAAADPFCPELRTLAAAALTGAGEVFSSTGTVVVIQGPRFSTRAESLWFRAGGAHTVNMTLVPEVTLAAELNMGTVNLSFVTDADAGLAPEAGAAGSAGGGAGASGEDSALAHESVSAELVFERLRDAQPRIVDAIEAIVRAIPVGYQPRELIAGSAVAEVLGYQVAAAAAAEGAHRVD